MYGREGSGNGWHFLVGSASSIAALTEAIGVTYRYLPDKKEYVHPAVFVTLTQDGRLSRYLYGVTFNAQTLRLALVEASAGRIGTTLDQILLFCFHYDSATGRYSLAARRLMTTGGLFTAIILGGFLGRMFWKESRQRRRQIADPRPLTLPTMAAVTFPRADETAVSGTKNLAQTPLH